MLTPGTECLAEHGAPLVGRFENDAPSDTMDQDFSLIVREPNGFGQSHRLTTAVVEDLCPLRRADVV